MSEGGFSWQLLLMKSKFYSLKTLLSEVVHSEALTRLLAENGVFTKEQFLDKVKVVDQEMKAKESWNQSQECRFYLHGTG